MCSMLQLSWWARRSEGGPSPMRQLSFCWTGTHSVTSNSALGSNVPGVFGYELRPPACHWLCCCYRDCLHRMRNYSPWGYPSCKLQHPRYPSAGDVVLYGGLNNLRLCGSTCVDVCVCVYMGLYSLYYVCMPSTRARTMSTHTHTDTRTSLQNADESPGQQ